MKKLKQTVNEYILQKKEKIDHTFRHKFHLMPTVGWMNDPNGFVFFRGEYHLFYQFYPYDSVWGPMHWGHAKSKDLIHWEDLPVALIPEEEYEKNGCFSGSALVVEDKLYLLYTGHYENDGERRETQCLAVSSNGIDFEKVATNPVIDERQLQEHGSISDFRDPKVFAREGMFYTVIATKNECNVGRILLFESKDLYNWQFKSVLLEGETNQGIMWECPDLFHLNGKDVLIMSPIEMERQGYAYYNINSTVAFIGEMDWISGKLAVDNYHEIDTGLDFYAPQTCEGPEGERIMVAWMQLWHRTIWTHELSHGWSGSMTFPRKLEVRNNRLIQRPYNSFFEELIPLITETNKHVTKETPYDTLSTIEGFHYIRTKINLGHANKIVINLFNGSIFLEYDVERELLTVTRRSDRFHIVGEEKEELNSRTLKIKPINNILEVECIVDRMSVEFFINRTDTMTLTFYNKEIDYRMQIEAMDKDFIIETLEISQLIM